MLTHMLMQILPVEQQYKGLSALRKAAGLTAEERASFSNLLDATAMVDTFRTQHREVTNTPYTCTQ